MRHALDPRRGPLPSALRVGLALALLWTLLLGGIGAICRAAALHDLRTQGETSVQAAVRLLDDDNRRVRDLARALRDQQLNGLFGRRAETLAQLERTMRQEPDLAAAYVFYEPNADGQDARWRAHPAMPAGRFLPYWNSLSGPLVLQAGEPPDRFGFYQGPKRLHQEVSTRPYLYEHELMQTFSEPLLVGGRFRGVSGVDRSLGDLTRRLTTLDPLPDAPFFVFSPQGRLIAGGAPGDLGHMLAERPAYHALFQPLLGKHGAQTLRVASPHGTGPAWMFSGRVPTGDWTVVLLLDENAVSAALRKLLAPLLLAEGLGVALLAALLRWLYRPSNERRPAG